jgi:hypothetical protein
MVLIRVLKSYCLDLLRDLSLCASHIPTAGCPERYLLPPQRGKKLFFMYEMLDRKKWQRCLRIDRVRFGIVLARTLAQ